MGRRRAGKQTVTVTGPVITELLGDPGPAPGPAVPIAGPGSGCPPPTHCPVCTRRIDRRYLAEHLGCYDPDANCTSEDVARWFRIEEDGEPDPGSNAERAAAAGAEPGPTPSPSPFLSSS
jgi:hypothetical protein